MAELLIKAIDFTHPDPDEDKAGSYKRGDVVLVCPDGCLWGMKETKAPATGGNFCIVKVPDGSVESLTQFDKPELTQVFSVKLQATVDNIVTCRGWRLNIDELPPATIVLLNAMGSDTISIATLLPAMERKVDGVRGDA